MTDIPTPKVSVNPKRVIDKFGDRVTGDYISSYKDNRDWGLDGRKHTVVLYDAATEWIDALPLTSKVTEQVQAVMNEYAGQESVSFFYSDGERNLISAAKLVG